MTLSTKKKTLRRNGVIRWYDKSREYGFIILEGIDDDLFFHRKDISRGTPEYELCHPDTPVSFLFKWGEKGPRALEVALEPVELHGELKWYDSRKEFGFAVSPDIDADIFFHRKDIGENTQERDLKAPGIPLSFNFNWDDKGAHAHDVKILGEVV